MKDLEEAYQHYLAEKTLSVERLLAGIGLNHACPSIMPTPVQEGYRNRAKFKLFKRRNEVAVYGTDPAQGDVSPEKMLWILPGWGRDLVENIIQILCAQFSVYGVDGFEIQLTHGRESAYLTLSVKRSKIKPYGPLAHTLVEQVSGLTGVAVPSQKLEVGESYLNHRILNLELAAHYTAFFQSNLWLTPELLKKMKEWLHGKNRLRILDLYCGVGLFSLFMGTKNSYIQGVDSSQSAVDSARKNAVAQGIPQSHFICSAVEKFLTPAEFEEDTLVFIDPPRQGCSPGIISAVAGFKPRNICLVSCSLDTHVHDLLQWQKLGYRVVSMAAFDMFPFTDFLETLTLLERNR